MKRSFTSIFAILLACCLFFSGCTIETGASKTAKDFLDNICMGNASECLEMMSDEVMENLAWSTGSETYDMLEDYLEKELESVRQDCVKELGKSGNTKLM